MGLLLISLSVVTFWGVISRPQETGGVVVDWWSDLLLRAFGWGSYVVVLVGVGAGVVLLVDGMLASRAQAGARSTGAEPAAALISRRIPWRAVVGAEIVFLALLGLTHLVLAGDDLWRAADAGRGGGYVGAVLSGVLSGEIGALPTGLILGGVLVWGLSVAVGLTLDEWVERFENALYRVRRWVASQLTVLSSRWPFVNRSRAGWRLRRGKGAVAWGGARSGPPLVADGPRSVGVHPLETQERAPGTATSSPLGGRTPPLPSTSSPLGGRTPPLPSNSSPLGGRTPPLPSNSPLPSQATTALPGGLRLQGSSLLLEPVPVQQGKAGRMRSIVLPSLDLLEEPDEAPFDESDIRDKAKIIEDTLDHFGVPAKVIEINWGPRVTQFGVEPGYVIRRGQDGEDTERKVRVAKIASLSNDLALALAAAPVRIEAPVPGRSIVGVEVPNSQVSQVSLRRVMGSATFKRQAAGRTSGGRGGPALTLALGEGVAGAPVVADLARMPHLLIAGATGSGKSVCINAIATCLLLQNSPYTLRMAMIDPKRVELSAYNGVPHLYGRVESDVERIVGVLRWLVQVMEERYKKFAALSARNLDDYNRHWRVGSSEYLPRVVVLIDELADMMFFSPQEVEHSIIRLAQMARATGMHLILATQRPSVDVVTGLIKANFPARIGFAVTSNTDSRVILDAVGAESLLSKGDMLYMAPDAAGLLRLQGCFVSDVEVMRTVSYWQRWADESGWGTSEQGGCPWDQMLSQEAAEAETDELLLQAIDIVRQQGSASASLLQRRMHIGYPRASRLIDEMEELGIIGPAESGGRQRQVLAEDGKGGGPPASTVGRDRLVT